MADDHPDVDPLQLWQGQTMAHPPLTLAQIHDKAFALQKAIRRQNLIRYVALTFSVICLTPDLLLHKLGWMLQLGAGLIMAATAFAAWQLHRRGAARAVPPVGAALIDSYRRELTSRRDAHRSIGTWYLAPFAPGIALVLLSGWFQPAPARPRSELHLVVVFSGVIMALLYLVAWLVNQRRADRLQRRIDDA